MVLEEALDQAITSLLVTDQARVAALALMVRVVAVLMALALGGAVHLVTIQ
jgi:hypothetical protein